MARNFNYEGLSETIPVREAHQFDVDRFSEYIRNQIDGLEGPIDVAQMRAGQSNPTYLLKCGKQEWVLRKKPPGELLPSAHAVEREYRVQAALIDTDVPVARMLHLCEDPDVIGTPFYVMERMVGRVFHVNSVPDVTPQERREIWEAMNDVLARIHRVDWKACGLADFGKPGNYFTRQVGRWGKQWHLSKQSDIPEMERLIEWLSSHVPEDDETTLIHGDFRLGNTMFHPVGPEVIAIFDWELSTLGHPLGDLAYNIMPFYMAPEEFNGLKGLELESMGIPNPEDYVRRYCETTDRPSFDLTFYMVFSLFRMAAIAEGILARAARGIASSSNAREVGAMTGLYAARAWGLIETKGLA
ncbi:MAG TPA: phosphotransferase family protein [Alphaproteobacteria bacterium]|nr:MAG: putative aminoglycoside phosphotransferase [Alphaproteobacteria bacterium MarineAlpha9_Bin6]HIC70826.1 phosphotransferase family protein [Alphaproteobacteria bacterium]